MTVDVSDDGLTCPEVGKWTEEKHGLVSFYAKLFSTGMKDKWDERVYIELYAGSGRSKIRDTSRTIAGSPIQALSLEHPFDKYIFCEKGPKELDALKRRVEETSPSARVAYILGDCNQRVGDILAEIPPHSASHRVLSLCFVDPYDIGIKFETLSALSVRFMDFLVLLAVFMDAGRNYEAYTRQGDVKVEDFLGSKTWRDRWNVARGTTPFPQFLANEFAKSMETLRYLPTPLHRMKRVRSDEKNLPLYYLALFSRKELAHKYWDEVLKYRTDQRTLF
jgi:three-Cys-motif partner protein